MSIIRRNMSGDGAHGGVFVSSNPLGHRHLIFDAVCQLFPDEMRDRVCHYSTRPPPSSDLIENFHVFKEENPTYDAELTVSKAGQTYMVEGTIRNKVSDNLDHVRGLIKAVPRKIRPTAEVRDKAMQATMSQVLSTLSRLEAEVKYLNHAVRATLPSMQQFGKPLFPQQINIPSFSGPINAETNSHADSSGGPTT